MDMECEIYMGKEDCNRQALNVYRMELLGAKVHPVTSGTMTLKDAVNEAMREWANRMDDTLYVLGSVMGPHPFPTIVRDFQSVISKEIKEQIMEAEGRLPDAVIACVGGGSNAMGAFYNFIEDKEVALIGCEAAGLGVDHPKNAATIANGTEGIFHGMKSLFCQNEDGQIARFIPFPQDWIIRELVRNMPIFMTRKEQSMCLLQMWKRWRPLNIYQEQKGLSRQLRAPTPSLMP